MTSSATKLSVILKFVRKKWIFFGLNSLGIEKIHLLFSVRVFCTEMFVSRVLIFIGIYYFSGVFTIACSLARAIESLASIYLRFNIVN